MKKELWKRPHRNSEFVKGYDDYMGCMTAYNKDAAEDWKQGWNAAKRKISRRTGYDDRV